jgi:type IV pilus assembly protein PilY1
MKSIRTLLAAIIGLIPVASAALSLEQTPLFIASTEPRVMLVTSRDHQLSIKAYTDYSDLDGDGVLDTTYKDSFAYYGYFDSSKCYSYGSGLYQPSGTVTTGTHQCGGSTWSGNFLNWASMTRMDILRKTFFGGYRSTDTTTDTVLERHFLPYDVHAFVKVYTPGSGMPTIQSLTGIGGQTSISLCNVSNSSSSTLTGLMTTLPDPLIRVAAGSWPQWDSSEVTQCAVNSGQSTQPTAVLTDYIARVKVCVSGSLETNCKTYTHPTTAVQTVKPTGLLQKYGDADAERRVRFGLMTGSYTANKSGGVLRKNTSLIANNNGAAINTSTNCSTSTSSSTVNGNANDEINICTGQFINQAATQAGIINTLSRLRIAGYQYSGHVHQYSCNSPGILSFSDGQCIDWGNPLSEIYLESLRYFANAGATTAFNVSDASKLASIPQVTWTDPLPSTEWCAVSSIVLLSTGLNSFDTDQLASFTPSGGSSVNAATLTQTVGDSSHEGINGGTYLIGDNGSTANNQCTAKVISNLATAKGICPEVPSTQGGYGVAGLAYAPKTIDLRPGYLSNRTARWGSGATPINPDWALRQPINTYAVQLAESLPSFSPAVGTGAVTLLPACQANSSGSASAWTATSTGWRNCSMTNLVVAPNVAMASVGTDATAKSNTCSGNGTTSQCFTVAWEDSTWGNDYDMDGIQRLGYCVGSACSTFKMLCPTTGSAVATLGPWASVASNNIVIATCTVQANAGHTLTFGYTLSGTTNDSAFYPILRPGNANFNVGSVLAASITAPNAVTFAQGASTALQLKNPLWYAAKYGGFTESTPTAGTPSPNLTSEWDAVNNVTGAAGADGIPDNYFDARNPANLITAMSQIFDAASLPDAAASSVATNTANLQVDNYIFQAKFQPRSWSGQLVSYRLQTASNVVTLTQVWDAAPKLDIRLASDRVILTKGATDGVSFEWANLTSSVPPATPPSQQTLLNTNALGVYDGLGSARLDYLRGDGANEGTGPGQFRARNRATDDGSILGDIVNSGPLFVGAPNAGYSDIDHPGYAAFRQEYLSRKPVVYVGSNDGMLHGFDAQLDSSGNPVATGGDEVIAYVPSQVYGTLSRLTSQSYSRDHRYLVDGTPMSADAYLPVLGGTDANKWRTVLIGGLNSGGKGYYALDITNPDLASGSAPTFSAANAASLLLWEFTDADDVDMGYAYNLPPQYSANSQAKQIVKLQNGNWAAIVGNGYNSTNGKAVLFVLNIEKGIDGSWATSGDYSKIVADVGPNNGLSTPVPYDSDGDGKADVAYAGDLLGNMWRFNLVSMTSSRIFNAGTTKPITTPPEVLSHPLGGTMVLFGTGKYLELADNSNTDQQTVYGVRDLDLTVSSTVLASELQEQTVSGSNRTVSPSATIPTTLKGWYMNLPASKERSTGIPKLVSGLFFFNTLIPSASACESGGTGWLMAVDALTGAQPGGAVFDSNNDGSFDTGVGGIQIGAALGGTTFIRGAPGSSVGVGVASLTSGQLGTPSINFGPLSGGRVNWREILR